MLLFFFFQAEDGIRDLVRSRGLGDVYKRQLEEHVPGGHRREEEARAPVEEAAAQEIAAHEAPPWVDQQVRHARATPARVIGVSGIIGGRVVRGMADVCLAAIGVERGSEGPGLQWRRRTAREALALTTKGVKRRPEGE